MKLGEDLKIFKCRKCREEVMEDEEICVVCGEPTGREEEE